MGILWYIWPRQYGKTHEVRKWWVQDPANRIIVTATDLAASVIRRDLNQQLYQAYPAVTALEVNRLLKTRVLSWRQWENGNRGAGLHKCEVALDDCVKDILRGFVGPGHTLAVISDAGQNQEPDYAQMSRLSSAPHDWDDE
jgi:hypothetical protein